MRGGREWQQRRGGPTEEERDRVSEQRSDPAEVSSYVAVSVELSVTLGG